MSQVGVVGARRVLAPDRFPQAGSVVRRPRTARQSRSGAGAQVGDGRWS